ncbi:hypothetical protein C2E23DRAFT_857719 [Lenzites betulinus]|nr:hypothetical protein C2E23DRAFT_857719 [Lenzites betulinus]
MSGARNNNSDNVDKTLFLPDVPRHSPFSYDPDRATPATDDANDRPQCRGSESPRDVLDDERNYTGTVVVSRGAVLTSTVTYSDLPDGYDRVAGQTRAALVVQGRDPVLVPQGWVRFIENPDSLAALVVSPGRDGHYRPVVGITHRKLRYVLQDAIDWYLKENDIDGTSVNATFMEIDDGDVAIRRKTPTGVSYMRVLAADQDFFAPIPEVYVPSLFGDIAIFLTVAGIVLLGYRCGLNVQNVLRVGETLYGSFPAITDFYMEITIFANRLALYMLKVVGKVVLRVDNVLALAREMAEL